MCGELSSDSESKHEVILVVLGYIHHLQQSGFSCPSLDPSLFIEMGFTRTFIEKKINIGNVYQFYYILVILEYPNREVSINGKSNNNNFKYYDVCCCTMFPKKCPHKTHFIKQCMASAWYLSKTGAKSCAIMVRRKPPLLRTHTLRCTFGENSHQLFKN